MESKKLIIKNYPKLIQEFAEENFNLKALCGGLLALLLIMLLLVVYLVKRGPQVIALEASGGIAKIEMKVTDAQIQRAAEEYLSYRYVWSPENIGTRLKGAETFIDSTLISSFRRSMLEVQKYVKEKKVTQRVHPITVQVDLKEKKVFILADRFTEFESLSAATKMNVVLDFSISGKTETNPWGVYIRKESEGELR